VGSGSASCVSNCFWDIDTSGQTQSAGGMGKTTAEMQTESTFTDAGWDFMGETANGTEDIWWILEEQDYPGLWWEQLEEGNQNFFTRPIPIVGSSVNGTKGTTL